MPMVQIDTAVLSVLVEHAAENALILCDERGREALDAVQVARHAIRATQLIPEAEVRVIPGALWFPAQED